MRVFRRLVMAFGLAGLFGLAMWVRGSGGVPPQGGGWREVQTGDPPPAPE